MCCRLVGHCQFLRGHDGMSDVLEAGGEGLEAILRQPDRIASPPLQMPDFQLVGHGPPAAAPQYVPQHHVAATSAAARQASFAPVTASSYVPPSPTFSVQNRAMVAVAAAGHQPFPTPPQTPPQPVIGRPVAVNYVQQIPSRELSPQLMQRELTPVREPTPVQPVHVVPAPQVQFLYAGPSHQATASVGLTASSRSIQIPVVGSPHAVPLAQLSPGVHPRMLMPEQQFAHARGAPQQINA